MIAKQTITGVVLAGGRGSRMGGLDKGLQPWRGQPLAASALHRLATQVGPVLVSANRHLDAYAALGAPVWPDAMSGYPGPLAGFMTGFQHCTTPYLVTVPCDVPGFPADLVERLALVLESQDAEIAMAATFEEGVLQRHPVFCLLKAGLADSLAGYLDEGLRRVMEWTARHKRVDVVFGDAEAFRGANTVDELRRLQD
jgi:molybdopterin-guanine dinucleotide biosynthesis protein A